MQTQTLNTVASIPGEPKPRRRKRMPSETKANPIATMTVMLAEAKKLRDEPIPTDELEPGDALKVGAATEVEIIS